MRRLEHKYGQGINIFDSPLMNRELARFGSPETQDEELPELMRRLYNPLFDEVLDHEYPTHQVSTPTRMKQYTNQGVFTGVVLDPETRTVVVNVIRAGLVPSQLIFERLLRLTPNRVRLDHLVVGRITHETTHVVMGSAIMSSKIDTPPIDGQFLIIADPMGATGGTTVEVLNHYQRHHGQPEHVILLHLIVTPEYIRRVKEAFPQAVIYALRLDRGLSTPEVLNSIPGERWDEEVGLTTNGYIVPGAGDIGAKMNGTEI